MAVIRSTKFCKRNSKENAMSKSELPGDEKMPFFLKKNTGFGQIRPQDDLLHPDSFAGVKDDSATETQYFGFSVPEHHVHALCYCWWHPNLKVVTGGLFVYQGVKHMTPAAELCDFRTFMSDAAIRNNDLHDFRLDNGYGVKMLEPLQRFHLTYANASNQNDVDLLIEAVLPAVMFDDGKHFEQTMRVKGKLLLRGKPYEVDCFTVRDRSWGKPRPEVVMPLPPMSWMVGTFSDTFSFNCTMLDHASGQPERNGEGVVPDAQALNGGWVYRDGKLGRIVNATKRVTRGAGSTICAGLTLDFTDEHGRAFALRASLIASCPLQGWHNVWQVVNLMRWECDGHVGYGDCQEAFWNGFLNAPHFRALT
jgi:hypothetical protein